VTFIGKNINETAQQSKLFPATGVATKLVDFSEKRLKLRVEIPCNNLSMCVVVAATEAEANANAGEPIGQDFSSNDNRFIPEVVFDVDSASQGEKWVKVITGTSPISLYVNEYTG